MADSENNIQSVSDDEPVIDGRNYDGIQEYDNPMPGWWIWAFIATIVWTPIYFLGVHQFGFINSYGDDLALGQAELTEMRDAFSAGNPVELVSDESIGAFVGIPEHVEAGAALYTTSCAMCHGAVGEGLIGPNLTDDYWVHGASNLEIFAVITNGVLEKGMTPWGSILSVEQRSQLVSYIRSIHDTNPPNAKAAEGIEVDMDPEDDE